MNTLAGTVCLIASAGFTAYGFGPMDNFWMGAVGVCMIAFGLMATVYGAGEDL